ncbi:MAG: hypothetical protein HOJ90_10575 [Alphaproteobacteria bacterium]|nr:hypothetical protein [Alphaproteobacteria bacterium]
MRTLISKFSIVAALLTLAACTTYTGSDGNPLSRSFTWFSFVAGDDIKAACTPDSNDHYRFVYNGVYERQIRAYELRGREEGASYSARARNEGGNLGRFAFSNPLGPWELQKSERILTEVQALQIINAYNADVAVAPNSAGQQFKSNAFYWIVASCQNGDFRIFAFDQDKVDLNALGFAVALLANDETGVTFRKAKPVEGFDDRAFYIKINDAADGTVGGL